MTASPRLVVITGFLALSNVAVTHLPPASGPGAVCVCGVCVCRRGVCVCAARVLEDHLLQSLFVQRQAGYEI